jgi:murein DD-endopeptidase MepM/ murein hydrolase activator NlpD
MGYVPEGVSGLTSELSRDLGKIHRQIQLEKASLDEINAKLNERDDWVNRFPSINPILGGRITSRFGWRIDPFTKKHAHHDGIDIPMPNGTSIIATADGVVKAVRISYTLNKNYGREIIIDHGYGYETRYAHCSKILVKRGEKVERWQPIGEVGETGKATGPHLHYEVIFKGERQNPEHYILDMNI